MSIMLWVTGRFGLMFDKGQKQSSTLSCDNSYFVISTETAHSVIAMLCVQLSPKSLHVFVHWHGNLLVKYRTLKQKVLGSTVDTYFCQVVSLSNARLAPQSS